MVDGGSVSLLVALLEALVDVGDLSVSEELESLEFNVVFVEVLEGTASEEKSTFLLCLMGPDSFGLYGEEKTSA